MGKPLRKDHFNNKGNKDFLEATRKINSLNFKPSWAKKVIKNENAEELNSILQHGKTIRNNSENPEDFADIDAIQLKWANEKSAQQYLFNPSPILEKVEDDYNDYAITESSIIDPNQQELNFEEQLPSLDELFAEIEKNKIETKTIQKQTQEIIKDDLDLEYLELQKAIQQDQEATNDLLSTINKLHNNEIAKSLGSTQDILDLLNTKDTYETLTEEPIEEKADFYIPTLKEKKLISNKELNNIFESLDETLELSDYYKSLESLPKLKTQEELDNENSEQILSQYNITKLRDRIKLDNWKKSEKEKEELKKSISERKEKQAEKDLNVLIKYSNHQTNEKLKEKYAKELSQGIIKKDYSDLEINSNITKPNYEDLLDKEEIKEVLEMDLKDNFEFQNQNKEYNIEIADSEITQLTDNINVDEVLALENKEILKEDLSKLYESLNKKESFETLKEPKDYEIADSEIISLTDNINVDDVLDLEDKEIEDHFIEDFIKDIKEETPVYDPFIDDFINSEIIEEKEEEIKDTFVENFINSEITPKKEEPVIENVIEYIEDLQAIETEKRAIIQNKLNTYLSEKLPKIKSAKEQERQSNIEKFNKMNNLSYVWLRNLYNNKFLNEEDKSQIIKSKLKQGKTDWKWVHRAGFKDILSKEEQKSYAKQNALKTIESVKKKRELLKEDLSNLYKTLDSKEPELNPITKDIDNSLIESNFNYKIKNKNINIDEVLSLKNKTTLEEELNNYLSEFLPNYRKQKLNNEKTKYLKQKLKHKKIKEKIVENHKEKQLELENITKGINSWTAKVRKNLNEYLSDSLDDIFELLDSEEETVKKFNLINHTEIDTRIEELTDDIKINHALSLKNKPTLEEELNNYLSDFLPNYRKQKKKFIARDTLEKELSIISAYAIDGISKGISQTNEFYNNLRDLGTRAYINIANASDYSKKALSKIAAIILMFTNLTLFYQPQCTPGFNKSTEIAEKVENIIPDKMTTRYAKKTIEKNTKQITETIPEITLTPKKLKDDYEKFLADFIPKYKKAKIEYKIENKPENLEVAITHHNQEIKTKIESPKHEFKETLESIAYSPTIIKEEKEEISKLTKEERNRKLSQNKDYRELFLEKTNDLYEDPNNKIYVGFWKNTKNIKFKDKNVTHTGFILYTKKGQIKTFDARGTNIEVIDKLPNKFILNSLATIQATPEQYKKFITQAKEHLNKIDKFKKNYCARFVWQTLKKAGIKYPRNDAWEQNEWIKKGLSSNYTQEINLITDNKSLKRTIKNIKPNLTKDFTENNNFEKFVNNYIIGYYTFLKNAGYTFKYNNNELKKQLLGKYNETNKNYPEAKSHLTLTELLNLKEKNTDCSGFCFNTLNNLYADLGLKTYTPKHAGYMIAASMAQRTKKIKVNSYENFKKIKPGTLIFLNKCETPQNQIKKYLDIDHEGFIVEENNKKYVLEIVGGNIRKLIKTDLDTFWSNYVSQVKKYNHSNKSTGKTVDIYFGIDKTLAEAYDKYEKDSEFRQKISLNFQKSLKELYFATLKSKSKSDFAENFNIKEFEKYAENINPEKSADICTNNIKNHKNHINNKYSGFKIN